MFWPFSHPSPGKGEISPWIYPSFSVSLCGGALPWAADSSRHPVAVLPQIVDAYGQEMNPVSKGLNKFVRLKLFLVFRERKRHFCPAL